MTPAATEELLSRIRDVLVREADPSLIVLFCSRARGDARPDSDVDLLVVEDEAFGPGRDRVERYGQLRLALFGIGVPLDLVLVSRDEFERWRDARFHVISEALREGRVLHARAA